MSSGACRSIGISEGPFPPINDVIRPVSLCNRTPLGGTTVYRGAVSKSYSSDLPIVGFPLSPSELLPRSYKRLNFCRLGICERGCGEHLTCQAVLSAERTRGTFVQSPSARQTCGVYPRGVSPDGSHLRARISSRCHVVRMAGLEDIASIPVL